MDIKFLIVCILYASIYTVHQKKDLQIMWSQNPKIRQSRWFVWGPCSTSVVPPLWDSLILSHPVSCSGLITVNQTNGVTCTFVWINSQLCRSSRVFYQPTWLLLLTWSPACGSLLDSLAWMKKQQQQPESWGEGSKPQNRCEVSVHWVRSCAGLRFLVDYFHDFCTSTQCSFTQRREQKQHGNL